MSRKKKTNLLLRRFMATAILFGVGITGALAFFPPIHIPLIGVVIPNIFSGGTTISSAAVNGDFQAVANQMPAVRETGIDDEKTPIALTAQSWTNLSSLTITAPSNGYVVVRFDGDGVPQNSGEWLLFCASDKSQSEGSVGGNDKAVASGPSSLAGTALPFSHTRVYPVSANTQYTYYAEVMAGTSDTYSLAGTLTVEFFPNSL